MSIDVPTNSLMKHPKVVDLAKDPVLSGGSTTSTTLPQDGPRGKKFKQGASNVCDPDFRTTYAVLLLAQLVTVHGPS